jgi:CRISPR/Cas system-associated exonuclease Cas4 (RecB family)
MTIDLIQRIAESVKAQVSDWPLYDDANGRLDRNAVLTASENLRCLRELKFNKTMPRPQEKWGMAQRGHAVEAWVVEQIVESLGVGEIVDLAGASQRSFLADEEGLSGTPDGLFYKDGVYTLLEFKSVDPRTNLEGMAAPKPQHFAQVQQNMWLLRKHGFAVDHAAVLYVDASDFQRMRQFNVPYDGGETAQRAEVRAAILFDAASPADLPAEGLTSNGCTYCAFKEECSAIQAANGEVRKAEKPVMPSFAPRGITESVREYGSIKEQMKALEDRADALSATIKEYAVAENQYAFETASYSVKVTEVAGRKTLDVKAYEKATGVSSDDFYKVGKPSIRLEVSAKTEN